jgi:hypothetical protein
MRLPAQLQFSEFRPSALRLNPEFVRQHRDCDLCKKALLMKAVYWIMCHSFKPFLILLIMVHFILACVVEFLRVIPEVFRSKAMHGHI